MTYNILEYIDELMASGWSEEDAYNEAESRLRQERESEMSMYDMDTPDELIETASSLQQKGYEMIDYDEYHGTETWQKGECKITLRYVE